MSRSSALILLAATGLGWIGCAEPRPAPASARTAGPAASTAEPSPLLDAGENLDRLSEHERRPEAGVAVSARTNVPLPPGIDAEALSRRAEDDPRAWLTLEQALRDVARQSAAFAPPPEPDPIDAERAEQALRLYARGRDLLLQDRPVDAITEFVRALQIDRGNPRIIRELARAYLTTGNESRAVALYEELLHSDPDEEMALFIVGLAATEQRSYELAAATLGRRYLTGEPFRHDPNADVIADFELARALDALGYDAAFIQLARDTLERLEQLNLQTRYRRQIGSIYRRRTSLWQSLGDARFRLGRVDDALASYERASAVNGADLSALLPRVIYANLTLGNTFSAQRTLLDSMRGLFGRSSGDGGSGTVDSHEAYLRALAEAGDGSIEVGDRDILLCTYLRSTVDDLGLLTEAVNDLYTRHPDDPGLARAAASLLPDDRGLEVLEDFISRRPRDLHVVQQQLTWLGRRDEQAAVRLTAELVRQHPDLAHEYTRRLVHAVPRPSRAIEIARELDQSPAQARVVVDLLQHVGAVGPAWRTCASALERWPDDPSLRLCPVRLSAALDEPKLVEDAIKAAQRPNDVEFLIEASGALSEVGEFRRAIETANEAVRVEPENVRAITAYARAMAAYADEQAVDADRNMWADDAIEAAEQAIRTDPTHDDAYAVIAGIVGPRGSRPDLQKYNALERRLRAEHPESRLAVLLQAQDEITQRRFEAALEHVLDLYRSAPSDASSLALAVSAWTNLERLDDAEHWFEEQLKQRPGDPGLLEYWTRVKLLQGEAEETVAYLRAEVNADASNYAARRFLESAYRAAGDLPAMLELREPRLLARPRGTRREVDLAAAYAEAGRAEEALERLDWVQQHVREAKEEHLLRAIDTARTMEFGGDRRDALLANLALSTLDRFPGSSLNVYQVGLTALARLNDVDDRFDDLARRAALHAIDALESTNEIIMQWRRIAQALIDAGHPDAAARALRARLQADPGFEQRSTLLLAVSTLGVDAAAPDNVDATIELVERIADHQIREQGGQPVADRKQVVASMLYSVSQTYSLVGNEAGAARLLEKVLELEPGNAMARNNLGYAYVEAGRGDEETVALLEEAYRLNPEDANILDSIGWLRYKQGILEDREDPQGDGTELGARTLIEKAIQRHQEMNPEVRDHIADVYWRLGEKEMAITTWKKVLVFVDDAERREELIQAYRIQGQLRDYGLVIEDPERMYERQEGSLVGELRAKIEAAERGERPPVAPTFEELRQQEAAGDD